jgi:3-methylcrotonyl-CoA carboxylase alpha subunit
LRHALNETHVVGTTTNLDFLAATISSEAFASGEVDTGFIEQHARVLHPELGPIDDETLGLAALAELIWQSEGLSSRAKASGDPYSPWQSGDGWRLNDRGHIDLRFLDGEVEITVIAYLSRDGYDLEFAGRQLEVRGHFQSSGRLVAEIGGHRLTASVIRHGAERHILGPQGTRQLQLVDPLNAGASSGPASGRLTSPLPGRVVSVSVVVGDSVSAGQTLMVIEAMKMEHAIVAPAAGTVNAVHFTDGDQVDEGVELLGLAVE